MKKASCRIVLGLALLAPPGLAAGETLSTLTLDALSYVSFQDQEILTFPTGSTIRFRFGDASRNGSVPFTLGPGDVSIPPISLPGGQTLTYDLALPANGSMETTATGRRISFNALVSATLDGPNGGIFTYSIPFSTESASATDAAGSESVSVSGMRMVDGALYVQIVGATVNRTNAFPKPGAAVYTVLSGRFDRVP